MITNLGNLSQVTNQMANSDLLNCISKQKLHIMALIIVITLEKFTHRTFWTVTSWSILCLITWEQAEQRGYSV